MQAEVITAGQPEPWHQKTAASAARDAVKWRERIAKARTRSVDDSLDERRPAYDDSYVAALQRALGGKYTVRILRTDFGFRARAYIRVYW